jgi:hypothetical protein
MGYLTRKLPSNLGTSINRLACLRIRVTGGSIIENGLHAAHALPGPCPFRNSCNDGHHLYNSHCSFGLRPFLESAGEKDDNTDFVGVKHHKVISMNGSLPFPNTPAPSPLPMAYLWLSKGRICSHVSAEGRRCCGVQE